MAEFLTRIATHRCTSGDVWEDIYTVPTDKAIVVSSITVCNTDNAISTFHIGVSDGGDPSDGESLFSAMQIAENTTVEIKLGITLSEGQILFVQDPSTRIDYNVFGSIIDQITP